MTKDRQKTSASTQSDERRQKPRRYRDVYHPNFQDMVESAVQGILVHRNFKPLYANASFASLFGIDSPEKILAMPLIRPLFPPQDWPVIEEQHTDFLREGKPRTAERMPGIRRDGREIWLSTTKRLIEWDGKKAVQITAFDITNQVEMERVMMGNEQRLRAVLDVLPVPVCIVRQRDGRILYINRKTCLLLEQSAGPLLRATIQNFFVDTEDYDRICGLVRAANEVREIEFRMQTAQVRPFVAEMASISIEYADEPAMLLSMNDISQRKKLEEELFHQANTDSLTGISNRRHFMVLAESELRRAQRFSRALSVIMMDLDFFKKINDTYGHAVGDSILESVVRTSLDSLRESDVMGRLGGEEFAILLPETDLEAAQEVATRLLKDIAQKTTPTEKGPLRCTSSLGVTSLSKDDSTVDGLLSRADTALFLAKKKGRNRFEVA